MLRITKIEVCNVNYKISQESLRTILRNAKNLSDYTCQTSLLGVIEYILEEFELEVEIGTFHDINNYIEYFIERCREIY